MSPIRFMVISCEIALRRIPQNTFDVRQQVITWYNVDPDLCRHTASPNHSQLYIWGLRHTVDDAVLELRHWDIITGLYKGDAITNLCYNELAKPMFRLGMGGRLRLVEMRDGNYLFLP